MARPLRIERAGAWYHITARGNERRSIYRQNRDYQHFCELLGETAERFRWRLHAYVLMPNHYHLLVETSEANLSASMQWLSVSYSRDLVGSSLNIRQSRSELGRVCDARVRLFKCRMLRFDPTLHRPRSGAAAFAARAAEQT